MPYRAEVVRVPELDGSRGRRDDGRAVGDGHPRRDRPRGPRISRVQAVRTMNGYLAAEAAPFQFSTLIVGSLAATTLILAMTGIYGMTAFVVGRRTRDSGSGWRLAPPGPASFTSCWAASHSAWPLARSPGCSAQWLRTVFGRDAGQRGLGDCRCATAAAGRPAADRGGGGCGTGPGVSAPPASTRGQLYRPNGGIGLGGAESPGISSPACPSASVPFTVINSARFIVQAPRSRQAAHQTFPRWTNLE